MALIMVIDDSQYMRPALRDLLQLEGHTVITTERTDEALYLLNDIVGVDLVIANSLMPEMDGPALTQHLRADVRYHAVPILLLASDNSSKAREEIFDAGADGCLVSPITVDQLKNTVEHLLDGKRA